MKNLIAGRKGYKYEVETGVTPADPLKTYSREKRHIVRFEVSYLNGSRHKGVNIFLRKVDLESSETPGVTFESFALFGEGAISMWGKILLRKSDKQVTLFAEQIDQYVPDIVTRFIADPNEGAAALRAVVSQLNSEVA